MIRVALLWLSLASPAVQDTSEIAFQSAPVEVDGRVLFHVRGVEARPAGVRAAQIAANIAALANDRSFNPDSLRSEDHGLLTHILGGSVLIMRLTDEDARLQQVQRPLLAMAYVEGIRRAILEHRNARTRPAILAGAGRSVAAIALAAVILALILWLLRRGDARFQASFEKHSAQLATEARRAHRIDRLRRTLLGALRLLRFAAVLVVGLFLLQYILIQFPWTRSAGLRLFAAVAGPLSDLGRGFVGAIPNLILVAIIALLARLAVVLARIYFDAVQDGTIKLHNFEPEWAPASYSLVRALIVGSALVIAYPYIPGSHSQAFKGVSILAGLMLSLSSTSAVGNAIAGYMILFRRAFQVGDRVKIGEIQGTVTDIRMQVTHIRTVKNEEITIPNSTILGSDVVNFSKPAREGKLILHTEVGIGYSVSWRHVEAILLEAADRTSSLLKDPPPFVLQLKLGEFAITYQINAYCNRADQMALVYAELHRNILDRFNEHGVQIMTPAYEGDPEIPKIVAKDQWLPSAGEDGRERAKIGEDQSVGATKP